MRPQLADLTLVTALLLSEHNPRSVLDVFLLLLEVIIDLPVAVNAGDLPLNIALPLPEKLINLLFTMVELLLPKNAFLLSFSVVLPLYFKHKVHVLQLLLL